MQTKNEICTKKNLRFISKTYGIVCNNTVYGGDCYGEIYCNCKTNPNIKNGNIIKLSNKHNKHQDYHCIDCNLNICGCCFNSCPLCHKLSYLCNVQNYICDWCGLHFFDPLLECNNCDYTCCTGCNTINCDTGKNLCPNCKNLYLDQ